MEKSQKQSNKKHHNETVCARFCIIVRQMYTFGRATLEKSRNQNISYILYVLRNTRVSISFKRRELGGTNII